MNSTPLNDKWFEPEIRRKINSHCNAEPTAGVFTILVLHKAGSNQSWIRKEIMGPNPHYPQVIDF